MEPKREGITLKERREIFKALKGRAPKDDQEVISWLSTPQGACF